MKEEIEKLLDKMYHHSAEVQKCRLELFELREMCDHDWVFDCYEYNNSIYQCRLCGKEKEE
jgi:hypothetical protein